MPELLQAVRDIDTGNPADAHSLTSAMGRIIQRIDSDGSGEISFDEFLASTTTAADTRADASKSASSDRSQDLPLLLTAYTTRKALQRKLGNDFVGLYSRDEDGNLLPARKPSERRPEGGMEIGSKATAALLSGMDVSGIEGGAALEGEGTIDFETYCTIVRKAEHTVEHSEESLRARFDAIDEDGSGTIDRREYVRGVLLERLSTASNRALEIFLQWDTDRSGAIDVNEFRAGVRGLGLTAETGFTDADVDAVFKALDADGSQSLDYKELKDSLRISKRKALALHRLHVANQKRARRAKRAARSGGTPGRHERNASAASRRQQGEKLLPLSDQVQTIYAEFKELRTKLGPPQPNRNSAAVPRDVLRAMASAREGVPLPSRLRASPRRGNLSARAAIPASTPAAAGLYGGGNAAPPAESALPPASAPCGADS